MANTILDALPTNAIAEAVSGHAIEIQQIDAAAKFHATQHYWEWMRLFERDPSGLISQHPDYVLHEIASSGDATRRPSYLVKCVIDGSPAGIGILAPKQYTTRDVIGFGPACALHGFRLAGNQFLGDDSNDVQLSLLRATLSQVQACGSAFLLMEDVIESNALWNLCAFGARGGFHVFQPKGVQPRLQIRFPDTADDYWNQFKSNRRWNFRKKIKKFGEHRFVRVTQPDQVAEFLEHAHEISKNSWQAQYLGLRIHNDDAELVLLTFLATQGALRSYILYSEDRPAAFIIGTQHHGYYDHAEIGYDVEFQRSSPGQVLLLQVLQDLIEHDTPRWVDFGGGDAEYKRIFANDESRSGNIWLIPPGLKSTAMFAYLNGGLAANRMARRVLAGSGLFKRFRQWTRGGAVNRNADR